MKMLARRRALAMGAASAVLLPVSRALSSLPEATAVTPELIAAAAREGKVSYYTALELSAAEKLARAFEARYPPIKIRVERTGAERLFQRIGQEYASRIHAVDVVNSADAAHFIPWKAQGWLLPYLSAEVAEHYDRLDIDADGCFVNHRTHLSAIAYNTSLVKAADAPRGFLDLLDAKWSGRIVKAHPGYSGTVMTATQQLARELGWGYFEKLATQKVLQVQSATDPPKKIALGERAVMADGSDYLVWLMKEKGEPVEIVDAIEGTPRISNPIGIMRAAPNPNAARLLYAWMLSAEGQQMLVDTSGQFPAHRLIKVRPGRRPLSAIKTLREDPAAVAREADAIKQRYAQYFKV